MQSQWDGVNFHVKDNKIIPYEAEPAHVKRERKKAKNRLSAHNARLRRAARVMEMEAEIGRLQTENSELRHRVGELEQRLETESAGSRHPTHESEQLRAAGGDCGTVCCDCSEPLSPVVIPVSVPSSPIRHSEVFENVDWGEHFD